MISCSDNAAHDVGEYLIRLVFVPAIALIFSLFYTLHNLRSALKIPSLARSAVTRPHEESLFAFCLSLSLKDLLSLTSSASWSALSILLCFSIVTSTIMSHSTTRPDSLQPSRRSVRFACASPSTTKPTHLPTSSASQSAASPFSRSGTPNDRSGRTPSAPQAGPFSSSSDPRLDFLFPFPLRSGSESATHRLLALVFYASSSALALSDDEDDDYSDDDDDHPGDQDNDRQHSPLHPPKVVSAGASISTGSNSGIDQSQHQQSTTTDGGRASSRRYRRRPQTHTYLSLGTCLVNLFVTAALSAGLCALLLANLTILKPVADGWRLLQRTGSEMGWKTWALVVVWCTVLCLRFQKQ